MKTQKSYLSLVLLMLTFNLFLCQNKDQKEALRQFVSFCKIQLSVENSSMYSTGYTYLILPALKMGDAIISKSEARKKLDEVLTNSDLRKHFLTYLAKYSRNDYDYLYFTIRPPDDGRYVSRVSSKDAKTLTDYILKNYKYSY